LRGFFYGHRPIAEGYNSRMKNNALTPPADPIDAGQDQGKQDQGNVDPAEVAKFQALAAKWWDPNSEFKPLHQINPLRLQWIDQWAGLAGKSALDVGCGGGILAEAMALKGAQVLGIDMADKPLKVANLHRIESGASVTYRQVLAENLAQEINHPAAASDSAPQEKFDVVTCMEMLEHVPDPESTIKACVAMAKPGGWLFFSTLNRNPKSFLFAIVGAEYVLSLLPKGTHDYAKFIKPSELSGAVRRAGLEIVDLMGMTYNPITQQYKLVKGDVSVNYLMACRKPL
jgi:2-polyprenyl-6-hydroxyphenyl methylase / 3-demethylubiquinone-9 3-methyltransferase